MVQVIIGINFEFDLFFIQDEIKFCLDEIDCVFGQIQFNGVNVLVKNGFMKIQVGVNDNQIIIIDLKQIDVKIFGFDGFSVKNNDIVIISVLVIVFGVIIINNIKFIGIIFFMEVVIDIGGINLVLIEGVYIDNGNDYYVKIIGGDNDGKYYVVIVVNDGIVIMVIGVMVNVIVIDVNIIKVIIIILGGIFVQIDNIVGFVIVNFGVVSLVKLQDFKGNDIDIYVFKDINGNFYVVDVNEIIGVVFVKIIIYIDFFGVVSFLIVVKLGGDDGKIEVVDIDGKIYDFVDLNGGNL